VGQSGLSFHLVNSCFFLYLGFLWSTLKATEEFCLWSGGQGTNTGRLGIGE
jgi:hypothetical protein